jgi:hypothetical protein
MKSVIIKKTLVMLCLLVGLAVSACNSGTPNTAAQKTTAAGQALDKSAMLPNQQTSQTLPGVVSNVPADKSTSKKDKLKYTPEEHFSVKKATGGVTITKFIECLNDNSNCVTDVVIPATIKAKDVTAVGKKAFEKSGITDLVIPASVTKIGNNAFLANLNLTSVTLAQALYNELTSAGKNINDVFSGNDNIEFYCYADGADPSTATQCANSVNSK